MPGPAAPPPRLGANRGQDTRNHPARRPMPPPDPMLGASRSLYLYTANWAR